MNPQYSLTTPPPNQPSKTSDPGLDDRSPGLFPMRIAEGKDNPMETEEEPTKPREDNTVRRKGMRDQRALRESIGGCGRQFQES